MSSTIHTELTGKETLSDFEKLLNLAEDLNDQREKTERLINKLKIIQLVCSLIDIAVILFVILEQLWKISSMWTVLYIVLIFVVFGPIIYAQNGIQKSKQHLLQDRRALTEVVGLLREVESVESKSPLERAYFRIRLSRFDIGY